ncbi:MAG: B12-binding domain-containing radical SAM protein [Bacteroidales bacterium]|nr:B12-binding domain-containing radical SAM protein [Bacteroidales bacterium]
MPSKSNKRKLLLINPLSTNRQGLILHSHVIYPPIGLGIVAALTPDHWEVEILDENWDRFEYKEADLVGITALTSSVTRAYELADIYRKKGIPTVLGGIHASMVPDEAQKFVDVVVTGEVESVWEKLIADFEHGRLKSLYRGELLPFKNAVYPARHLFHKKYQFASIQTTRGCPMKCDFCSVHQFNGNKYRERPVGEVLDELETIEQEKIYFVDDNLIGYGKRSQQRTIDLFKGMIERGIKKQWFCSASMNFADNEEVLELAARAGCMMVLLGIESERIEQLEETNKKMNIKIGIEHYDEVFKKIHKYGISVLGAFIYGLESDTPETMANRTEYINNADIDAVQATVLTPLPGTGLFKRMQAAGEIDFNNYPGDWERYDFVDVVFNHKNMSKDVFFDEIRKQWDALYNDHTLKKKFLRTLKHTKSPLAAIWSYGSNLQYYNMVYEGIRPRKNIEDIFGLDDSSKEMLKSSPFR